MRTNLRAQIEAGTAGFLHLDQHQIGCMLLEGGHDALALAGRHRVESRQLQRVDGDDAEHRILIDDQHCGSGAVFHARQGPGSDNPGSVIPSLY